MLHETGTNHQRVIDYLKKNPLPNIMLLKMAAIYRESITAYYLSVDQSEGILILLPTKKSLYDAQTYPETQTVVMIKSDNTAVTQALLPHIPRQGNLLFKLFSEEDAQLISQQYPLKKQRGFISFTSKPQRTFSAHAEVTVLSELDERLLPMFHKNNYGTVEIQQWFAAQNALGFAIYQQDLPVSVGMAFQNYGDIWEIGGLHTAVTARRQGHGQKIVETALHTLQQQGKTPRFQCHEANVASLYLAEKIGLDPFLLTEHFLYIRENLGED